MEKNGFFFLEFDDQNLIENLKERFSCEIFEIGITIIVKVLVKVWLFQSVVNI